MFKKLDKLFIFITFWCYGVILLESDFIAFYQEEVIKLNQELNAAKNANKARQISDVSPEKLIGYFLLKNINDRLSAKKYIDLMQTATDFRFNVFEIHFYFLYTEWYTNRKRFQRREDNE